MRSAFNSNQKTSKNKTLIVQVGSTHMLSVVTMVYMLFILHRTLMLLYNPSSSGVWVWFGADLAQSRYQVHREVPTTFP